MYKNIFVSLALLFLCVFQITQAQDLSTSSIKQEWKDSAPAVVRKTDTRVLVDALGKVHYFQKEIITIFKSEASSLAVLNVNYDSKVKVKKISGSVYDVYGKLISANKKSDIKDFSNFNSFSIYEDNRVKVLDMKQYRYPYTVVFEQELEFPNLYYMPNWYPQNYSKVPVENASINYEYPADKEIRFFSKNISLDNTSISPQITGNVAKEWRLSNLDDFETEPMIASDENLVPVLYAAPSKFDFEGYQGDMSSWESMGAWFYQLNMGKDELPEATRQKVNELVLDKETTEEKVKVLYEYLQSKTRYVSIQLGIGGLQPFDAYTVDKYSYGDCKALSNYMGAMLKHAGIKSHYALVYGGRNLKKLFPEFPNDYFNHVILAVPMDKDTVWLECTNQTTPFGYLGAFTSNRYALLITEDGGKLVKTTKYGQNVNLQNQKARIVIDPEGKSKGKIHLTMSGLQVENSSALRKADATIAEKKEWIAEHVSIPNFDILDFHFEAEKSSIPLVDIQFEIESNSLVNKTGSRFFLQPNQLNLMNASMAKTKKERKYRFERTFAYVDSDTIEYLFPENFFIDFNPEPIEVKTEFGEYKASFDASEGKLIYTRHLKMNEGIYEAEKFENYKDFLKQVEKADKTKIVLNKKT